MKLFQKDRYQGIFIERKLSFIIFASPKSGTTWMQRLLSAHPEAVCAESRAFGVYFDPASLTTPHITMEKYVDLLKNHFAPSVDGLRPADNLFYRTALFNMVDALAATTMNAVGKSIYGEKLTPYRGTSDHVVEMLHEYDPKIRFVNLTRDGRDVIVSGAAQWLNQRLRRAPTGEKATFETALRNRTLLREDFDMFLDYWTDAVGAGLKARKLFPNYLPISYEEFLADPISQAADLFGFLGLDASPGVVSSCVEATAFDKLSGGRRRGEEDPNSFFRKGEVGDWKNWFTEEHLELFELRAGDLLRELGYDLVNVS
ncbi:MAG: hypothetical protein JWR26_306 [Pedosphaera sp.]|nr:hypothetical protein [Pedosphaera sp.]